MQEKRPKITAGEFAAQRQFKQEANALIAECFKLIFEENNKLSNDLALIGDLISWGGMDKWMTIWSVINNLTDGTEVEKLTQETNPESKFYKNPAAVYTLKMSLEYWLNEGLIRRDTTLKKSHTILAQRREENVSLLKL